MHKAVMGGYALPHAHCCLRAGASVHRRAICASPISAPACVQAFPPARWIIDDTLRVDGGSKF